MWDLGIWANGQFGIILCLLCTYDSLYSRASSSTSRVFNLVPCLIMVCVHELISNQQSFLSPQIILCSRITDVREVISVHSLLPN